MIIPIAFAYCFTVANAPSEEYGRDGFNIFFEIIMTIETIAVAYVLYIKPYWLFSLIMAYFSIIAMGLATSRKSYHVYIICVAMLIFSLLHCGIALFMY